MTAPPRTAGSLTSFRLDGSEVIQCGNGETRFDPQTWGEFRRGAKRVRACRIPGPFKVGPEICRNGYLVYDGRLMAISASTFTLDYQAIDPKNPEDAHPGEWETAA